MEAEPRGNPPLSTLEHRCSSGLLMDENAGSLVNSAHWPDAGEGAITRISERHAGDCRPHSVRRDKNGGRQVAGAR